jgi:peptidoglycan/LPS O-acetylase OafA/YrhL
MAAWLLVRPPGADPWHYAQVATLMHIYLGTPLLAGLTQFWSLAVEVGFYLLLPAIAAVLCRGDNGMRWIRRTAVVLLAAVALGPVWMAVATAVGRPEWRLWLPGFIGWFAVGMLLALWHAGRTKRMFDSGPLDRLSALPGTMWTFALGLLLIASTSLAGPLDLSEPQPGQALTKSALYTLIAFCAVLPTVGFAQGPQAHGTTPVPVLDHRGAAWLGTISYGIFGYHVIVLASLSHQLGTFNGHFWLRWGLTLAVVVPIAAASYYGIERPAMRRSRGGRARTNARATTQATADQVRT